MKTSSRLITALATVSVLAFTSPGFGQSSSGGSSSGGASSSSSAGSSSSVGTGSTMGSSSSTSSNSFSTAPATGVSPSVGAAAPGAPILPNPNQSGSLAAPGAAGAPAGSTAANPAQQTNTFPGSNPPSDVPVFNSTNPSSASSATPSTEADAAARATSAANPGSSTGSGGINGTPAEAQARQNLDQRCRDVLAHKDYFTANVIQACQQQARAAGQATDAPQAQRELPTGSIGSGIAPIDRPSEVQKSKEPSDQKALKGVCTNC